MCSATVIQVYKFFYGVSIFIFKSILLYSYVPIANLELLTLNLEQDRKRNRGNMNFL